MQNITPVETYNPPRIPTLAQKPSLCELPKRWARNAAVVACIGVLGASALAGCASAVDYDDGDYTTTTTYSTTAEIYPESTTYTYTATTAQTGHAPAAPVAYSELDFNVRMHGGGSGSAFYVVHLTEQEMQGIIRAELERAGLRFGATPPSLALTVNRDDFSLNWFDRQRNIAVLLIGWEESNRGFSPRSAEHAQHVQSQFAQLTDISIGVFYNPGETAGQPRNWLGDEPREPIAPTNDEVMAVLPILHAYLVAQAQNFIYLQGMNLPAESSLDFTIIPRRWEGDRMPNRYDLRLTDQQAMQIIRTQLAATGLNLERANVAIEVNQDAWQLETRKENGRIVGVFGNVWMVIADRPWQDRDTVIPTPSRRQAAVFAPVLRARLVAQTQAFILHLESEGIR